MVQQNSTNIVLPNWFLQILTGLATVAIIGATGWMGWVTRTLHITNGLMNRIPVLEQRVTSVEGTTREHSRMIRDLKRVKVTR